MKLSGNFRQRVLAREFLAGTWLNLGSSLTAEMAGLAGFDWVVLDHEHGPGSDSTVLQQLQAVSATPAAALVRIAANEPPRFKRVLDAGAQGVVIPYVSTPAEARAAVSSVRYPPRGLRGVAKLNRAAGFGVDFDAYFAHAHEWIATVPQIETAEGVAHAAEIAAIDGVDVLFVGPMDLTTSLGIPGNFEDARYRDAVRRVADAARGAGKAAGVLLMNAAQIPMFRELGYTFVALSSDGGMVVNGMAQACAALRRSG